MRNHQWVETCLNNHILIPRDPHYQCQRTGKYSGRGLSSCRRLYLEHLARNDAVAVQDEVVLAKDTSVAARNAAVAVQDAVNFARNTSQFSQSAALGSAEAAAVSATTVGTTVATVGSTVYWPQTRDTFFRQMTVHISRVWPRDIVCDIVLSTCVDPDILQHSDLSSGVPKGRNVYAVGTPSKVYPQLNHRIQKKQKHTTVQKGWCYLEYMVNEK